MLLVQSIKTKLRNLFNDHHSLHVTDNEKDTMRLTKTLFSDSTIKFYNNTDMNYSSKMISLYENYQQFLNDKNDEDYCLTSSYIMAII